MRRIYQDISRTALVAAGLGVAMAPAQAQRLEISPYVEAQQILSFDLGNNDPLADDVVTYSSIAAGLDASMSTRRVELGASYRYERRIAWDDALADDDVHSGLLRANVALTRGLSLEAGALAARARAEIGGNDLGSLVGDNPNSTQVYSFYGGPTLSTNAGPLQIAAAYRLAYTHVEDNLNANSDPTRPAIDYVDNSTYHQAYGSVGMEAGNEQLPFGWTATAGYEREDAKQLDQRYEGTYARLDVTVPVTSDLAIIAGVGYENIEVSQRDVLVDANGEPVLDGNGRFQSDPNTPRLLAFETDGFIYDAGIMWRPSSRLQLMAVAGERYDTTYYAGSISYSPNQFSSLNLSVYNTVDSFGRGTTNTLAGLPTDFTVGRNGFSQFDGCAFGNGGGGDSGGNAGGCFGNDFQSLNSANFRSRGASLAWSGGRGPWNYGVGAGYQNRRYLVPVTQANFSLAGVTDEVFALQGDLGYAITPSSNLGGSLYANWYNTGIVGEPDVFGAGGSATYSVNLYRGLSAQASAGLFANDVDGQETDWLGSLLLGMRYGF